MIEKIFAKDMSYEEKLKLCLDKTLVSEEEIKEIINNTAKRLNEDYKEKKVLIVSILKGALIFTADLCRQLNLDMEFMFLKASSYGDNGAVSSANVEISSFEGNADISAYHVLIIDDILDTGKTFLKLKETFAEKKVKSIEFCVLLDKYEKQRLDIDVKYTGVGIKDFFVVGYGLDYKEKFRHLPYIASIKEEIYK